MPKYTDTLNSLSVNLSHDYLQIGNKLSQGCYNKHIGYSYDIFTLKQSKNNNDSMFIGFSISKNEYWSTIHSLNDSDLNLYFNALYEFSSYMGSGFE